MFRRPMAGARAVVTPKLLKAIESVLAEQWQGLSVDAIRQSVVTSHGVRALRAEIESALHGNPNIFISQAGGIWRLANSVRSEELVARRTSDARTEPVPEVRPYVATLPDLSTFVAFDVETTGLKVSSGDRIIQVSAVRMVNGSPSTAKDEQGTVLPAVFNEYVSLSGIDLSYGLCVKLGFVDHPEWFEQLLNADPIETVLPRFRKWVGDLPLVAHNAKFDHSFLEVAAAQVQWPVTNTIIDSMELACLARPDLAVLRLEPLAEALGIFEGNPGGHVVESWADELGVEFTWGGFHNAIIDVLVLAAVVPQLMQSLKSRLAGNLALAGEFTSLLPNLMQSLGVAVAPGSGDRGEVLRFLPTRQSPPTERLSPEIQLYDASQIVADFSVASDAHGLKQRKSQMQMIKESARAYSENRIVLIEAPTGTGKTFAYLYPSVLWARMHAETVVVATHTRALQDQMDADVKRVRELLGRDFRAEVLKGISNYICVDQAAARYAQMDVGMLTSEECFVWAYILSWLATSTQGMLDELSYWARLRFPALDRVLDELRASREICSHEQCASCQHCFHHLARRRAATADIVVMNHALLLSKEWADDPVQFSRVVIDEAHNLEDAATNAATDEVSSASLMYLVNRLLDRRTGQGLLIRLRNVISERSGQEIIAVALANRDRVHTLTKDFGQRLHRYLELNQADVDPRYGAKLALDADPSRANPTSWRPTEDAREQLVAALDSTTTILRRQFEWLFEHPLAAYQQETLNELDYLADKCAEQADLLDDLLRVGYDRLKKVHWIEVERAIPLEAGQKDESYTGDYNWAVKRAPVRVGPFLDERLYQGKQTLIFTSATLRTTQDLGFEFWLDRLGLKGLVGEEDAIALPPELDYSRALFTVARYMRADARPTEMQNFVDEVGQELGWFFRFTGGNGLTLFTARDRMLNVYESVEPVLSAENIPLGCQGETGGIRALLEEIKSQPGSVVFGLKSFWEGIDVAGPNLSYVVMEKLPFPMLFEPLIRARSAEVQQRSGHEFSDYILPLMLIAFKQGFGRLIRREDDLGAVVLLDKRVWTKEYYRDLLNSLPGRDGSRDKAPVVLEESAIVRSRRNTYRAIAEHMAAHLDESDYARWLIDWDRLNTILDLVPEELFTRIEQLLAQLQVPDITPIELMETIWAKVQRAISELFHFAGFRDREQEQVVAALLSGRDALVILPTGSGKSFTFQLPALLRDGTTLVFSPLKALMKDQVDKLVANDLSVADRIDSSQTAEEQERVYQRMREGTTRLVYIAPERIRDPKLMAAVRTAKNIVQIVVDEAHCVHMWGQSFRPDFLYISKLVNSVAAFRGRRPPVAAFTATATPAVRESIADKLELLPNYVQISRNPNRPELRFVVYNHTTTGQAIRSQRDKLRILMQVLKHAGNSGEMAIVYVNTTKEAERLAQRLDAFGINVRFYHGKMDDQARKDVQDMFLEGQIQTIIATKAFGMGIDKSDIRYVVHYQIPADLESYYQEAGRAGRDGEVSWAILLYHESDLWIHRNVFIPQSLPNVEVLQQILTWLNKRFQHAHGGTLHIDPRDMTDALGFEEERELGVHLHVLEELGFVIRDTDVTLKCVVRLLCGADEFVQHAAQLIPEDGARAIETIFGAAGVNGVTRTEVALVELARAQGTDPAVLDQYLYTLALHGIIIYRAFARAYTLSPGTQMVAGARVSIDAKAMQQIEDEMYAKLDQMIRYAVSQTGDCLRSLILNYFGESKPSTPPAACCSLCSSRLTIPWQDVTVEDFTDPNRYFSTMYEVLKAVAWNASLDGVQGRSPYGPSTLAYIVLGDEYAATHLIEDAEKRRRRRQLILESPYYGILNGLQGGRDKVDTILGELRENGFIANVRKEWEGGNYWYPAPTEKGLMRLEAGELFPS